MQIDPLLGKTKKFYAARFYQLKIGHGAIGTFLKRIGATETAEYWWCGNAEQSISHTSVHKVRAERRVLRKSLGKAGIQWQRRPEKRWLAELLADKYAIGPSTLIFEEYRWEVEKAEQKERWSGGREGIKMGRTN